MTATLDDLYLEWLYDQVVTPKWHDCRTYWFLMRDLYSKEFVWIVANDDNRVEDGRDLREEFRDSLCADHLDPDWRQLGCSVLEMMVALARRLSFEDDRMNVVEWFWQMLENLRIAEFDDPFYSSGGRSEDVVDHILENLVWRNYKPNGAGGLFPLRTFDEDQTCVEIWYQMNAYLLELE